MGVSARLSPSSARTRLHPWRRSPTCSEPTVSVAGSPSRRRLSGRCEARQVPRTRGRHPVTDVADVGPRLRAATGGCGYSLPGYGGERRRETICGCRLTWSTHAWGVARRRFRGLDPGIRRRRSVSDRNQLHRSHLLDPCRRGLRRHGAVPHTPRPHVVRAPLVEGGRPSTRGSGDGCLRRGDGLVDHRDGTGDRAAQVDVRPGGRVHHRSGFVHVGVRSCGGPDTSRSPAGRAWSRWGGAPLG